MFEKAESVATCQSEETCSAPEGDENVEEVAVNVNLLIVKPAVGYVIEGVSGRTILIMKLDAFDHCEYLLFESLYLTLI
jgi:hypothetical protein